MRSYWDVARGQPHASTGDLVERDTDWHTWTCILGFPVMGIWWVAVFGGACRGWCGGTSTRVPRAVEQAQLVQQGDANTEQMCRFVDFTSRPIVAAALFFRPDASDGSDINALHLSRDKRFVVTVSPAALVGRRRRFASLSLVAKRGSSSSSLAATYCCWGGGLWRP